MNFNSILSALFGNKSSRDIKKIQPLVDKVKEAILDGVIGNNFAEADAFMRLHAPELGLHEV